MNRFTISDIENLCGIKAHTLRIWEKRYGIVTPKRKESNHRYYDNEGLKYILQIAYLYHNGYKISKIAGLPKEALIKLTSTVRTESEAHLFFMNSLLEAAFTFNEDKFEETLDAAIERLGFEQCIQKVVYPYFEKIGLLWMNDIAVPSQEHFSSNIIRNKIIIAIDKIQKIQQEKNETFLLFTPEGEHHEIPLLFAYYLFKKQNKHVIYAGADNTIETLKIFCTQKKIDHLFFYVITNFTKCSATEYLAILSKTFLSQKITMAGPLTRRGTLCPSNCTLIKSFEEMVAFIKS